MNNIDIDIENCVIGSLINWYADLKDNIPTICESDFAANADLFKLIKNQYEAKYIEIDLMLMITNIDDEFEKTRVKTRIMQCCEYAISVHSFQSYLARLKELSLSRRLNAKLQDLVFNGCTLEDIQRVVDEEKQNSTLQGAINKANENFDNYIKNVGIKQETIRTGFSYLDKVTGGFKYGTVAHIGARPSTGKTAFALNIAIHQTRKVVIFSLEMSCDMIFERIACNLEMIDYRKFTDQKLDEKDIRKIKSRMQEVRNRENLFVFDDIYNIERIATTILEIKPDLVIIDYIQKVTTTQRIITAREKIDYISSQTKQIAKYNNCCLIALSQLSRDGKDAPTMSSLKESGALEADGDYIMLLHRPYVQNKADTSLSPETTELLIDKNKFGSCGKIDLCFKGEYQQFREVEKTKTYQEEKPF